MMQILVPIWLYYGFWVMTILAAIAIIAAVCLFLVIRKAWGNKPLTW